jgi:hypothetical protein
MAQVDPDIAQGVPDMTQVVPSMAQEVADTAKVVAGMAQEVRYIGTNGYRNGTSCSRYSICGYRYGTSVPDTAHAV